MSQTHCLTACSCASPAKCYPLLAYEHQALLNLSLHTRTSHVYISVVEADIRNSPAFHTIAASCVMVAKLVVTGVQVRH